MKASHSLVRKDQSQRDQSLVSEVLAAACRYPKDVQGELPVYHQQRLFKIVFIIGFQYGATDKALPVQGSKLSKYICAKRSKSLSNILLMLGVEATCELDCIQDNVQRRRVPASRENQSSFLHRTVCLLE